MNALANLTAVENLIDEAKANAAKHQAAKHDPMYFLRRSLNTASLTEIKQMIEDEVLSAGMKTLVVPRLPDPVILGNAPRHYLFQKIFEVVSVGLYPALIGPAGAGKSTVCSQVAEAAGKRFFLQNAVTGTHELSGYMDAQGRYNTTAFREAFSNGGLILVDEVDTSDPSALKWINTALANGYAMFPDQPEPVFKHTDFTMIIAANTFGNGADRIYVGANQLDASTLDRFVFLYFRYDTKMEKVLSGNLAWCDRVQLLRLAAEVEKVRIVVSPRATYAGAKLLAIGWPQNEVEDALIWKGIDGDVKDRILKQAGEKAVTNAKKK